MTLVVMFDLDDVERRDEQTKLTLKRSACLIVESMPVIVNGWLREH